jgi:hypothetical protein
MATMDFTTKPLMLLGLLCRIRKYIDEAFGADPEVIRVDLTCDVRYIELPYLGFQ